MNDYRITKLATSVIDRTKTLLCSTAPMNIKYSHLCYYLL